MNILNIPKFLNDHPKLTAFLMESGCHLDKISSVVQTPHDRISQDYIRARIKSRFITYEVSGKEFYIKIQTDIDDQNFYLENLYVKDGFF